ncbi:MAG TPA: hypothetical protein PLT75_17185, partial [Spirochaetota bacterium]|nr:hypothetical protein [Spirochaetota bacterium]
KPAPEKLLSAIQEAVREFTELQQIAEKENTGTSSSVTPEIQERLNTFAAGELLSPFLKRTFVYLARKNDVPPEKSTSMIYTDIVSASGKVIRILEKAEHLLSQP